MAGLPVVLVIDGDDGHRLNLVSILEAHGFPCASTPPGAEAVDLASRVRPGLVLVRRREDEAAWVAELRRAAPGARVIPFVSLLDQAEAAT